MSTPYADQLGGRDAVVVLQSSLDDYRALVQRVTPTLWQQPWAPGKWTLQQILVHVAQWEMIFGVRVRCAVGMTNYTVQPLDQDDLIAAESSVVDPITAFGVFVAVRRMNLLLASWLSADQRKKPVQHLERGQIDVDDLLVTMAGHPIHHYKQIAAVVGDRDRLV
jgi:hypothetical protein